MKNPESNFVCFTDKVQLSLRTLERIRELQEFASRNRQRFTSLSQREREILALICSGMTNEEIAKKLFRSVHTVRTHRNNIWRQLEIRSLVDAMRWAQAFDLV